MVIILKIYIDLVLLINFFFDLLLLCALKIILKRNIKFFKLILGALFGSLSVFLLFLKINSIQLFAFKILISIIMLLLSFGYKNIRYFFKNFVSLYVISSILGGFLYLLNIQFSYKHKGLIFFHNGLSINIIFLVLISPLIIYIYIKENKLLKNIYGNYYKVKIVFNKNKELNLNGYLDTGNNLQDPISHKMIILVNRKLVENIINIKNPIYVPYKSINHEGLLECLKAQEIYVNKTLIKNTLIGLSNQAFALDDITCLLNNKIREMI